MKKFLSLLLVLCAAITISAGNIAQGSFKKGGTWKISEGGELFVDVVTIPDYKDKSAYDFGETEDEAWHLGSMAGYYAGLQKSHFRTEAPWGQYYAKITSIRFSSSVEKIGEYAFEGLKKVQQVSFDTSSKYITIGDGAFADCIYLKTFDFSRVISIGCAAFRRCVDLTSNNFPLLQSVDTCAFDYCTSLAKTGYVYMSQVPASAESWIGLKSIAYICYYGVYYGTVYIGDNKLRIVAGDNRCTIKRNSSFDIIVKPNNLSAVTTKIGEVPFSEYTNCTVVCGDGTWSLNKFGTLILFAECNDFQSETSAPWYSVRTQIKNVGFKYGIQNKYIGNNAFKGYTNLKYLSSMLTGVGANAFSGCTNLSTVDLSKCTSIGASAFANTAMSQADLTNAETIGANAFAGSGMVKVTWGTALQSIGSKAFQNTPLKVLIASGSAPTTASDAFNGVTASNVTLRIPANVANTYEGKSPWSSFTIEKNVSQFPVYSNDNPVNPDWVLYEDGTLMIWKNIPNYNQPQDQPWYNYREFISEIRIIKGVKSIGNNAFSYANTGESRITRFEDELESITTIGNNAFKNNDRLVKVLAKNVQTIGNEAFANCSALTDVDFGDKLTSLGSRVFDGCPAMENFALDAITPPSVTSQTFVGMGASASGAPGRKAKASGSGQGSVTLSVPEGATVNYLAAPYWNLFSMEFIEGHGAIVKSGAYYDGAWVLYADGTLIASSQTTNGSIDVATVYNDATVTRVEFLGGANEVKSTFFSNLPNLKTVVLNAAVNKVGYRTFQNCAKLESINLENVDTIESEAFKGCSKLASVKLSAIQYINTNAFEGCTKLASVELAGNCRIRSRAFKGCTSLTSIDLKGATIDGYVFEGCTALSSISRGGMQITTNAFNGCSALKKFDLGSGCWTVYSNAFANTNMQTIYCSRPEPTKLYADAFGSLTLSNITAYVPADYIRMYQKADVWKEMTLKIDTTFESMLPTGGAFGDKGTWQLDDKGTLTLTGAGSMPVLTDDNRYHWNHVFDEWAMFTEDVIISDGWTGINTVIADKNATANKYKNIKTLELGADIKLIRDSSLRYPNLTDVYCYIPDPVNIQTSTKNCPFDKTALIANNATLHVINFTGTKAKYQNSSAWNWFPNIVDDLVTRKEGIIYVTNVYMNKSFDMLAISQSDLGTTTYQLNAGVQPANATTTALAWSSSNPSVATVDQNGLVTFVGFDANDTHGSVTITAKATDGSGKKASCDFSIYDADEVPETVYVEEIDVDKHAVTRLKSQPEDPVVMIRVTPANAVRSFSTVVAEDVGFMAMDVMNDHGDIIGLSIVPWGDKTGTTTVTVTANNPGATQANLPSVTFTVTIQEDIIFVEDTKEGVPVTYIVDDLDKKTCHLYGAHKQIITVDPNTGAMDSEDYYINAVDPSTTGIVTIPTSVRGYAVTGVGDYAFRNCASITEVNFCAGMERIGEGAFQGCNALTTLRLPYTFKGLGLNMASMLPNLKDVHLLATTIPTSFDWSDATMSGEEAIGTGAFDGLREEQHDATLHVATGCATLYENAGWDVWFPIIVEDGEEVDNNIASYVCDFTTKVSKHSAYNDAWTYDTEWTVYGGANNNAGWDYVKMGGKSGTLANANPVYVMNKNRMGRNITAIRVTYPSGSFPKNNQMDCSEWGVKVYSDLACTNLLYTVTSSVTITGAEQVVTLKPVPGQPWKAGYGIQVYWNLSNTGSTNGIIWVSKIEYLTDADDAATLWPMYNISFVNWDGFVLQNFPVRENTMPVFEGVTPVHAADAEYTYEFSGWSPEIVAATADAVYTAQYTATPKPVIPDDPDPGTGVDNVQSNEVKCTKILYNGQLYIIRGDMIFNASGMRIK